MSLGRMHTSEIAALVALGLGSVLSLLGIVNGLIGNGTRWVFLTTTGVALLALSVMGGGLPVAMHVLSSQVEGAKEFVLQIVRRG